MTPQLFSVHGLVSFTLAILLLFLGKTLVQRSTLLRQYCIPESVVGGFVCAAVTSLLYFGLKIQIEFDLQVRDTLLLYFFAGIGLKSDMRQLLKGGRPLLVLLLLAGVFIVLQNSLGMGVAEAFGPDPKAGLMVGSISLTGGAGTTLAWAPLFIEKLGISNAHELGMASNTVGLIAACVIGGPIANRLISRYRLKTSGDATLEVGILEQQPSKGLDYYDVLWAWMWLNLTLMLGYGLNLLLENAGITLPKFVSCLFAGIVIHHIVLAVVGDQRLKTWSGASLGLALISDICLGMFLTMALMGLQLWATQRRVDVHSVRLDPANSADGALHVFCGVPLYGTQLRSQRDCFRIRGDCPWLHGHGHRQHDHRDAKIRRSPPSLPDRAAGVWLLH